MASRAKTPRRILSVVVYGSAYLALYFILLALLVITPADAIERSLENRQIYNIWILTAGYVTTIVVVGFIFFTRLYINKTELASIPKEWVPIEKGDVRSRVHKMIAAGLSRSATVAYASRPRLQAEGEESDDLDLNEGPTKLQQDNSRPSHEGVGIFLPPRKAVWGEIEHYGWASPNSSDLPNLQYSTVLSELPNLIEGKALTLAPPDPTSQSDPPLLDADAVALLQRTANMDLRDYVVHLSQLGILDIDATTTQFLSQYEYARFSTRPISNARFKELMHLFAEVLRSMRRFNSGANDEEESMTSSESQVNYDLGLRTDPGTPLSNRSGSETDSLASSNSSTRRTKRDSSAGFYRWCTAPNSLRSRVTGATGAVSRKSSNNSLALSRRRSLVSNKPSSSSLRSRASASSGSVIRLATRHDTTDLPYILSLRGTADN